MSIRLARPTERSRLARPIERSRLAAPPERSRLAAPRLFLGMLGIAFAGFVAGAFSSQPPPASPVPALLDALAFVGALSMATTIALLVGMRLALRRAAAEEREEEDEEGARGSDADEARAWEADADAARDPKAPADARRSSEPAAEPAAPTAAGDAAPVAFDTRRIAQSVRHLLDLELGRYALTPQELVVAEHILRDETYAAIGRSLYLTESTVKFHARNIFAKAHVKSKREFIALIENNMAGLPGSESPAMGKRADAGSPVARPPAPAAHPQPPAARRSDATARR
ncbi:MULTISPECIES: helix-turn-helix transcriptional regulator [unclassified Adlercreutzia]|uniref:helix-turn-helix transcriptional regulator n=1 Tax=unclassified Adlercreutzia TaxID=2636013 RepID=UPI0013EC1183|nr:MULTISPECIES: helix-turn-helix transcriptional regulator [unclassified Adlercreutzia]